MYLIFIKKKRERYFNDFENEKKRNQETLKRKHTSLKKKKLHESCR